MLMSFISFYDEQGFASAFHDLAANGKLFTMLETGRWRAQEPDISLYISMVMRLRGLPILGRLKNFSGQEIMLEGRFPQQEALQDYATFCAELGNLFEWALFVLRTDLYHDVLCVVTNERTTNDCLVDAIMGKVRHETLVSTHEFARDDFKLDGFVATACDGGLKILNYCNEYLASKGFLLVSLGDELPQAGELMRFVVRRDDRDIEYKVCQTDHLAVELLNIDGPVVFPGTTSPALARDILTQYMLDYADDIRNARQICRSVPWFFSPFRSHEEYPLSMFSGSDPSLVTQIAQRVPSLVCIF